MCNDGKKKSKGHPALYINRILTVKKAIKVSKKNKFHKRILD